MERRRRTIDKERPIQIHPHRNACHVIRCILHYKHQQPKAMGLLTREMTIMMTTTRNENCGMVGMFYFDIIYFYTEVRSMYYSR